MKISLAKNIRRLARLELRAGRIDTLIERANDAGNTALVAAYEKEARRRVAEANYLTLRCEADLEDLDAAGQKEASALRDAVLAGSRGSRIAKAIIAGKVPSGGTAAAEAATE